MKSNVSIIIPTLNRPKLLERAILSIINQSYKGNIAIIVVDSSQSSSSEILCKKFKNLKNRELYYYKNENSIYPIDNYIYGAKYITGEYSKFLCDDDWLEPDFIKKSIRALNQFNATTCISNINLVFSNSTSNNVNGYYKIKTGIVTFEQIYKFIFYDHSIPVSDSTSLFKSNILIEAFYQSVKNLECTRLQFGFDFFINYYAVFNNSNTVMLNESLVNSWVGNDSITINSKLSKISYCNFFAFLRLTNIFNIEVDENYNKDLLHKVAVIKLKSYFDKNLKKLVPDEKIKTKFNLIIFLTKIIKKIKIKYFSIFS